MGDAAQSKACPECGSEVRSDGNILHWREHHSPIRRSVIKALGNQLNPLSNYLLPFRHITDWRVDRYYERTLADSSLAQRWATHYLDGLGLPEQASVLDHGCGRGRHSGLLTQLGHRVFAQDISASNWWKRLPSTAFQSVPADAPRLPWMTQQFDLVGNFGVLHYLPEDELDEFATEVRRVLKPGGSWICLEANAEGLGAGVPRKLIGRLHTVDRIKESAATAGFDLVDVSYEGFYSPVFPRLVNFFRKVAAPGTYDVSDYGSWIESKIAPESRALWLLRFRKTRT